MCRPASAVIIQWVVKILCGNQLRDCSVSSCHHLLVFMPSLACLAFVDQNVVWCAIRRSAKYRDDSTKVRENESSYSNFRLLTAIRRDCAFAGNTTRVPKIQSWVDLFRATPESVPLVLPYNFLCNRGYCLSLVLLKHGEGHFNFASR